MKLEYETQTIEFDIKYSNRKTMKISLKAPDIVEVVAPKGISEQVILDNVRKNAKWIITKLSEIKENEKRRVKKEYIDGEVFLYLGKNYELQLIIDDLLSKPIVKFNNENFIIKTPTRNQDLMRKAMEHWYRQRTYEIVVEKANYFQKYFEVKPRYIKVKEQKKRWASCTSNKDLLFNWRCSMAPSWVLDYIVIHEMCHMVHMNHSNEFWALVENIMPDYKKKREWLRTNGVQMVL